MTTEENTAAKAATAAATSRQLGKRLLNSMWAYWMFLLAVSFVIAGAIYWIWLRGAV